MRLIILIILTTLSLSAVEWQRADLPGTRLLINEIFSFNGDIIIQDKSTPQLSYIYMNNEWKMLDDSFLDTLGRILVLKQFNSNIFISTKEGNYLSSDSGRTWMNVNGTETTKGILNDKYYFGSNLQRKLHKYKFSNNEWSLATYTNDSNKSVTLVGDILKSEGNLLVSSEFAAFPSARAGVRISTDAGDTWYDSPNFDKLVVTMEIADGVIYVMSTDKKLYYSEDNGMTWQVRNSDDLAVVQLVNYSGNLYSLINKKVFKSTNKGNSWELFDSGIEDLLVDRIRTEDDKLFLFSDNSQLYKYSDELETWEYNIIVEERMTCKDLRIYKDTLFSLGGKRGIIYSTDNGMSWSVYSETLSNESKNYWDLKINEELIVLSNNGQFITISDDNGESWTTSGIGYINSKAPPISEIVLRNDTIILFTTIGIKVSTNKGEEWIDYFGGDLNKEERASDFFKTNSKYFIRNSNGVYSTDYDLNDWELVLDSSESGILDMRYIFDYWDDETIYYDSFMNKVGVSVYSYSFKTGQSKLFWDNLSRDTSAHSLLKARSSYIMAYGSSVIVSHDEGKNWESYKLDIFGPDSLNGNFIYNLLVKDNRLIVATRNGIAYADLSEFGITTSVENEIEPKNTAYPNPATNSVSIDLDYNQYIQTNELDIKVYDVIGNEVSTEGEFNIENDKVMWNCASKPSGVYFIRIDEEIYKVIKE